MDPTPKVGVYICHCGTNIAGKVDVTAVTEFAATLPYVAVAREYGYMCSDPGQELIKEDILEGRINRAVVASCSPLMHEVTFRRACEEAGLNPFFFQMANIREQCSWVTETTEEATDKAKRLVAAAVHRVVYHEPLQIKQVPVNPSTLILGGGIAGIEAALRIADAGKKVYLVEREAIIGGHVAQLHRIFPVQSCFAPCVLKRKTVEVLAHENIELLTLSEVESVSGYVGNFQVRVRQRPRYVIAEKCTGCGECARVCPVSVPDEFEARLTERKAVYRPAELGQPEACVPGSSPLCPPEGMAIGQPFPPEVPNAFVIDREACTACGACVEVCPEQCIDLSMGDKTLELNVGTIILATGFSPFDCSRVAHLGYGRLDNVYSALEFERLMHPSGPTGGKILLKDGRPPRSIAILHCVGSRDKNYNEYCSRVCCMYAMKLAHLVRKHTDAEVYEIYTDLRAFGKGYEEFFEHVRGEGVKFIYGEVAEVTDQAESPDEEGKLIVVCERTYPGQPHRIPVDMVILANGMEPQPDAAHVGHLFGVSRGKDGFFLEKHPKLAPVETSSDGIFIAGCCQGPKDIPDSIAQAGAAAAGALAMMDRGLVSLEPSVARVDTSRCSGCGECVIACPYNAIQIVEGVAEVSDVLCKGCGTCAAACLVKAIDLIHYTDEQLVAEVQGLFSIPQMELETV